MPPRNHRSGIGGTQSSRIAECLEPRSVLAVVVARPLVLDPRAGSGHSQDLTVILVIPGIFSLLHREFLRRIIVIVVSLLVGHADFNIFA